MQSRKLTRREMLRLSAGLTTGAVAATWLAGCAPAAAPGSDTGGEGVATERTTVRIQAPAHVNTLAMLNLSAEQHMEENPDVEIVLEETIYGEIARKTETGFVSGTLQDLCYWRT